MSPVLEQQQQAMSDQQLAQNLNQAIANQGIDPAWAAQAVNQIDAHAAATQRQIAQLDEAYKQTMPKATTLKATVAGIGSAVGASYVGNKALNAYSEKGVEKAAEKVAKDAGNFLVGQIKKGDKFDLATATKDAATKFGKKSEIFAEVQTGLKDIVSSQSQEALKKAGGEQKLVISIAEKVKESAEKDINKSWGAKAVNSFRENIGSKLPDGAGGKIVKGAAFVAALATAKHFYDKHQEAEAQASQINDIIAAKEMEVRQMQAESTKWQDYINNRQAQRQLVGTGIPG
jgi:hypothetical protein